MGKRNIANEMSVEELIGNGMTVSKKFDVDPDTKNEFGTLLAQISQRFPSTGIPHLSGCNNVRSGLSSLQYIKQVGLCKAPIARENRGPDFAQFPVLPA